MTINCQCITKSCEFTSDTECSCLNTADGTSYNAGCFYSTGGQGDCKSHCSKCNNEVECTGCKDGNSELISGSCFCLQGFFTLTSLEQGGSCQQCMKECKTCENGSTCSSCKDPNTILVNYQCTCAEGFYLESSTVSFSCSRCSSECKTCSDSLTCLTCSDPSSTLVDGKCLCNDGFFPSVSQQVFSCGKCLDECLKCQDGLTCLTCSDPVAQLKNSRCECSEGFYQIKTGSSFKCAKCGENCKNCSNLGTCDDCNVQNSFLKDGICICSEGFFANFTGGVLTNCLKCDSNCLTCESFSSCLTCKENFEKTIQGKCFCPEGFFVVSKSGECNQCPAPCTACDSSSVCKKCSEFSYLGKDRTCVCNKGFYLNQTCKLLEFYANLTVSQDLNVTLWFDDLLGSLLKSSQLSVKLNRKKVQVQVKKLEMDRFSLIIDSMWKTRNSLEVYFLEDIFSINNARLVNKKLTKNFELTRQQEKILEFQNRVKKMKEISKFGAIAGFSLSLGVGLANFDLNPFFDFLNTAEIFYSTLLFNVRLNPLLKEFLLGIRMQKTIPRFFKYIISSNKGEKLTQDLVSYGYSTNLFILNTESYIQTLTSLFLLFILLIIVKKCGKINSKIESIYNLFHYSAFLKFWLQSFLEIIIAVRIATTFTNIRNPVQILDIIICMLVSIVQVFLIFLMFLTIHKKSRAKDEVQVKQINEKFSTFFSEFKENEQKEWFFYPLYIGRRVIIFISCQFIRDGYPQMILPTVSSFSVRFMKVLFYIIGVRCYKSPILNVYHILKEILLVLFHVIVFYCSYISVGMDENNAFICIYIITICWTLNVGFTLYTTGIKVRDQIKKCLANRKKTAKVESINIKDPESFTETEGRAK